MKNITRKDIMDELKARGLSVEPFDKTSNGIIFEGIAIFKKDSKLSPVIYVNDYIENYDNLSEIVDEIISFYADLEKETLDNFTDTYAKTIFSVENIKKRIKIGLQRKLPSDLVVKNTDFEGIESYLYISEIDGIQDGIIRLKKEHLNFIDCSVDEIWECAERNTLKETMIKNMGEIIAEMFSISDSEMFSTPDFEIDSSFPMYVITNNEKRLGASGIILKDVQNELVRKLKTTNFIMLPSSVHEVIVIPLYDDSNFDMDEMTEMVTEVNGDKSLILPEDQLGDKAYNLIVEK